MDKKHKYQPQKFPCPNTIPSGWDYSGLENASRGQTQPPAEDVDRAHKMDTFPKTASFPPGQWDMPNLKD